jgi:hypothetical protein
MRRELENQSPCIGHPGRNLTKNVLVRDFDPDRRRSIKRDLTPVRHCDEKVSSPGEIAQRNRRPHFGSTVGGQNVLPQVGIVIKVHEARVPSRPFH